MGEAFVFNSTTDVTLKDAPDLRQLFERKKQNPAR